MNSFWHTRTLIASSFLGMSWLLLLDAGAEAPKATYKFQPEPKRIVGMLQGERVVYGRLDEGDFYEYDFFDQDAKVSRGGAFWEYRSGTLVKGVLDKGVFYPSPEKTTMPFKDYKPDKGVLRIYNLPGEFVNIAEEVSGKIKWRREFKAELARWVRMLDDRGKEVWGYFDETGKFHQQEPEIINKPKKDNEPVWEYRSGSLIKGLLKSDGTFVPELGSDITRFKDYKFEKGSLRIYNLPGRFVEKQEKPANAQKDNGR